MKALFILLIILLSGISTLYSKSAETYNQGDPSNKEKIDSIKFENVFIVYHVLLKHKSHYDTKLNRDVFECDILFSHTLIDYTPKQVHFILHKIANQTQVDVIRGYNDKEAYNIYYQAMKHLPGQMQHLKKNMYYLDIHAARN